MPRTKRMRACGLAALVVLGTLVAMVPASATATAPSTQSTDASGAQLPDSVALAGSLAADARADSVSNNTALLSLATSDDSDVTVAGGVALPENYSVRTGPQTLNGTLLKMDDDGVAWQQTFATENATTQVTDVALGPDGDVYALVSSRNVQSQSYPPETTVEVVHATADGDVVWRHELNASARTSIGTAGDQLRATDQGVAVAYGLPGGDGVRLAELAGGDPIWNRTYGVAATPTSLQTTHDGFLVTGNAQFSTPWVLRTGQSGQVEFNRTIDGATNQRVVGAVPTEDGGVLLAGTQTHFGGADSANTWVSRLDGDGLTRWSRVYGVGNETRARAVYEQRGRVLVVEQGGFLSGESSTVRLRGVDDDGTQLFSEVSEFDGALTASNLADDEVTLAGVTGITSQNLSATMSTVSVPDRGAVDRSGLQPDTDVSSNETAYRGQNLRFTDLGANGDTYELVRVPDERDEFDPHVVRRIDFDDGEAVIESATLPAGEYVLRDDEGESLVVDDGRVADTGSQSEAAFGLRSQDFFRLSTNRTFVDAGAGADRIELSMRSDRSDYVVHVRASDVGGESASADELRDAFGHVDGFTGIEDVDGSPVAVVEVNEEPRMTVSAAAFDAGLYEVTVASPDTREAGGSATGRIVVAHDSDRQVDLSLNESSLTVTKDGTVRTDLTVSGVENGISALSVSANRSGTPAVWPDIDLDVNASRASGSAGGGQGSVESSATAFQASTGNGTVTIGSLGIETNNFRDDELSTGSTNVTLRIDWIVDDDGVPYAVPDPITVPVEVVDSTNATDGGSDGGEGTDEGGVGGGEDSDGADESDETNESESAGSGSGDDSGREGESESGSETGSESTDSTSESTAATDE